MSSSNFSGQIAIEQILGRKLLQQAVDAQQQGFKPVAAARKPLLLMCALERRFEQEILSKSEKGKDYLRLVVDFAGQTMGL